MRGWWVYLLLLLLLFLRIPRCSTFTIMAGAHNVKAAEEEGRIQITSYNGWNHPGWNADTLHDDIALIELPSPLQFNKYISAICLANAGEEPEVGSETAVTGWGLTSDGTNQISPVLMQVFDLPIISNDRCKMVFPNAGPGAICVNTAGGHGSCSVS